MNVKEFKTRWLRGYVNPELRKLPVKSKEDTTPVLLSINIYTYNRYNVDTGEFSSPYNINNATKIIIIDTKDNSVIYNGKKSNSTYPNYSFNVQRNHTYKIKVLLSYVSYVDDVWHEIKVTKDQTVDILLNPYPIYYVKTSVSKDRNITFTINNNKYNYASYFNDVKALRDICNYEYYENNTKVYSETEIDRHLSDVQGRISNTKWSDYNSYVVNEDGLTTGLKELSYDFVLMYEGTPEYHCILKLIPSNQKYYVKQGDKKYTLQYGDALNRLYFYSKDALVEYSTNAWQVVKAEYTITNLNDGTIINEEGYVKDVSFVDLITCGYTPMNINSNYGFWESAYDYWTKYDEYFGSEINRYKQVLFTYYSDTTMHFEQVSSEGRYTQLYNKLMSDTSVTDLNIEKNEIRFPVELSETEWYSKKDTNPPNTNHLLSSVIINGQIKNVNNNTRLITDNDNNLYWFSSPSWSSYSSDYDIY